MHSQMFLVVIMMHLKETQSIEISSFICLGLNLNKLLEIIVIYAAKNIEQIIEMEWIDLIIHSDII